MPPRLIIGDIGGGAFGMKSSLPGYDVNAVTDQSQLSFNSEWANVVRPIQSGTVSTGPSGQAVSLIGGLPSAPFTDGCIVYSGSGVIYGSRQVYQDVAGLAAYRTELQILATRSVVHLTMHSGSGVCFYVAYDVFSGLK